MKSLFHFIIYYMQFGEYMGFSLLFLEIIQAILGFRFWAGFVRKYKPNACIYYAWKCIYKCTFKLHKVNILIIFAIGHGAVKSLDYYYLDQYFIGNNVLQLSNFSLRENCHNVVIVEFPLACEQLFFRISAWKYPIEYKLP